MREREYRSMDIQIQDQTSEERHYIVKGYASTFERYKMFEDEDGTEYFEQISPNAFDDADMSDAVFRVDHAGTVYARTSAGTVKLWTDEHGLANETDLSRTQKARDLFEDIAAGNYPKMSFAFVVAPDGDHFDRATHTRVIDRIAKVFDIAPVSFPANPTTELSVSTRDYFNGVIEAEKAERLECEKREIQKQRIRIMKER